MHTAALIVAAGMSSRMGDFKPMLNIGSISIAQRVVANFQQAGVDKIVMITGYNATMLERHLTGNGIVFLRNEQYETTQMFESVCIGLKYLEGKCDRILFTPVDIPLFTAATVGTLLASEALLASPVCDGKAGHPTLIDASMSPFILSHSGEGGLRGALENCPAPITEIAVDDRGILHDADTPEDYRSLLKYHNEQLVRPVVNVALAREKYPNLKVEVEADSMDDVMAALDAKADIIMLDNMDNATIEKALKLIGGKALTEASGGITLDRLPSMSNMALTYISVGALTHSAPSVDIGLDM